MQYDVLIIGNGFASNLIARHLVLQKNDIKICIVGMDQERRFKVGESLTEAASHYMMRRLKLMKYMQHSQIHKNGLRFHYNDEYRTLPFKDTSEIGSIQPLVYNTFHIDRFVIEQDLIKMNKDMGVEYHVAKIKEVRFEEKSNVVVAESGEGEKIFKGRWVLDGTGGARVIAKQLGLCKEVDENYHASVWGHFKGENHIDFACDEKTRLFAYVNRELSTNHFVGYGYWFWIIPLLDGCISVGLVYDTRLIFQEGMPNKEQFLDFIRSHKGLDVIFDEIELINFASREKYSYTTTEFINSEKSFALLADAAAFCDPLYSSGIDGMARQSDWYCHLILKSLQISSSKQDIKDLEVKANESLTYHYNTYFNIVLGNNASLGSSQIGSLRIKWDYYAFYLNLIWPYIDGNLEAQAVSSLGIHPSLLGVIQRVITNNFKAVSESFRKKNLYYRYNKGFMNGSEHFFTFLESLLFQKLDKHFLGVRTLLLTQVIHYILLSQFELYFQRKDLSNCQYLVDQLRFDFFSNIEEGQKKHPEFFFKVVAKIIAEMDSSTNEAEFWRKWIRRISDGLKTVLLGPDFYKAINSQLIAVGLWSSQSYVKNTHPSSVINHISEEYQKSLQKPMRSLRNLKSTDLIFFFKVEAIAAGLFIEGEEIDKIILRLNGKENSTVLKQVAIGCGVGLFHTKRVEALTENLSPEFLNNMIDGFGFAMGLEAYLYKKMIFFPDALKRALLVRGLGRSVTYYTVHENRPEKYRDYFMSLGLYPCDETAYYEGVGFSLCFSKSMTKNEIFNLPFEEAVMACVQRGVEQAEDWIKG